mgnify:CR=1 FL=1
MVVTLLVVMKKEENMKKKTLMCFSLALLLTLGLVGTAFGASETWNGYRATWTKEGAGTNWCRATTSYGTTAESISATATVIWKDGTGASHTTSDTYTRQNANSARATIASEAAVSSRTSAHKISNNTRSWSKTA